MWSMGPRRSSEAVACSDSIRPTNGSTESTASGASLQGRLARRFGDRLGPAVTFATTEHFNLQTAREANGRASIYLAALSSNLIALAFIGQMSRLGAAFYAFAVILLPMLAFMGVVTFQRLVQSSIEDIAYAQRIARLRAFYVGLAPELDPFLLMVQGPHAEGLLHGKQLRPSTWQLMLTTAGMVGVVSSAVIGACAGLAIRTLAIGSFAVALIGGSITGVVTLVLHRRHHRRARDAYRPERIDRAAIVLPMAQDADAA
jgi:hypothetical protein